MTSSMDGPMPSSSGVSERMRRQRRHNTGPELALRRELRARGVGYRLHRRPLTSLAREADVIFRGAKVVVFVDGCYWHGCPEHASWPRANARFWRAKIERNRERDRETDRILGDDGWTVLRVWEHEDAGRSADRIAAVVRRRRLSQT
jgi:DNA mismatch endonuclease (patch repair protein)